MARSTSRRVRSAGSRASILRPARPRHSRRGSLLVSSPGAGVIDVAFIGETAYVLVTLVLPDHVAGIYRIDDPDTPTVIADLGVFSPDNPPPYPVDAPAGLQFAMQPV